MLMKGGEEDQDVIEATAALKGMLGIGGLLVQEGSTPAEGQQPQAGGGPSPTAKAKRSKKKKNKAKAGEGQEGAKPAEPEAAQEASAAKAAVATDDTSSRNRPNAAPKKKKKKAANKKKNDSENYAWSAFQSSPDASKLPIPEFSSPVSREKDHVPANLAKSTVPVQLNPPEAEDSAESAPAGGASGKGQSATNSGLTAEPQSDSKEEDELLQSSSSGDAAAADEVAASEAKSPSVPAVSETGINLAAALAGSPPHNPSPDDQYVPAQPPVQPYQQQVPHHQNPPLYGPGHGMPPPQMYPYPPAPRYPMPPAGSPNYHPANMQGPPPPPPPPPGYVTIQVQVPAVLMPGRQMIVTSPSGYPVQVVVPEGIPPGMIIPVHVPAGPPMHLMPPPPPHPSSYGRY